MEQTSPPTPEATPDAGAATPNASVAVAPDRAGAPPSKPGRRSWFKKIVAVAVGGVIMAVPAAAGLMVFLDPVRRRKGGTAAFLPVAPLQSLPDDGLPRKFAVVADRSDAWNKYPRDRVGAVYLKREKGSTKVTAFNVVCPHAGCFVDANPDGSFKCPCHNSGFNPDGSLAPGSVSPRGLDELQVDEEALKQGTIKVKFQKFLAGMHDKIPQS